MEKMNKNSQDTYIVAGCKSWNKTVFNEVIKSYPGSWHYAENTEQLDNLLLNLQPRYIFLLHWKWKVPSKIIDNIECVCFHMTDVPYGRGGSPLQNLIVRGHQKTKLTSLRMTEKFDAGPVYLKRDFQLHGNANDILYRATTLSAEMIQEIIKIEPNPVPQSGDVTIFKRRKPHESEIPAKNDLQFIYDHIRMLDGEGYPKAFLMHNNYRYEFENASILDGKIKASVTITPENNKP